MKSSLHFSLYTWGQMFFYILMSTSLSFALPRFDSQRISFSPPLAAMLFLCISLLDVANLHHFNAAQLKTIPCLAVSPRNDSIRSTAQPSQTKSILCLCCSNRCRALRSSPAQETSPCLFIVLLNSAPPFHGYPLLN